MEHDRPSRVDHPSGDAFPYREGGLLDNRARETVSDTVAEGLGNFIDEQDPPDLSPEEIIDAVEPHPEDGLQIR